ncbi:TetR/AcrR family transcriptional regulator [Rugamonas sp.]|uniref:TetR/AcrR family transcriptional regulator n=1 Tax=Rugamonas sp. TaxID=1926287 RepID=UPI0025D26C88|nr:TetR/AcrR family transcriptional regulator [Rugamonas sp.]
MRKSKADTAETRKRIVEMASKVFLTQGLAATGVADIMAAAGLTQGGFYRHFESKEALIAEANGVAIDHLFAMFAEETAGLAPRAALDLIVTIYLSQLQQEDAQYLCPLANLGSELRHADAQIKASAADGYQRLVQLIASKTEPLGIARPLQIADAIVSTIVGAVTLSKLTLNDAAGDAVLANAKNTVDMLLAASASASAPVAVAA